MKTYYADTAALKLLQILISVLTLLLLLLVAVTLFYFRAMLRNFRADIGIAAIACILSAALVNLVFLPWYFKNLCCVVTPDQIAVKRGILFQHEQSIRIQSVQFVQTITGFRGKWGMHFLILYVYGGSLSVCFLKKQDYQELVTFLERKGVFYVP